MKFFILTAFALLAQPSWACLNDSSILTDGKWIYEGVWNGKTNGTLEIQVVTDSLTQERRVTYASARGQVSVPLLQCSEQPGAIYPGTHYFFGHTTVTDSYGYKSRVELTLHAVAGRLTMPPNEFTAIYTQTNFTPKDDHNPYSRSYFTAGHCINRANQMQWCGTIPRRVK
ncbi:hypothetical protein D3C72_1122970 [compost metagenome]